MKSSATHPFPTKRPARRERAQGVGASIGAGVGGAAAAGDVDPAVIPAQELEAFTVAVPFQVRVMTNVAVR